MAGARRYIATPKSSRILNMRVCLLDAWPHAPMATEAQAHHAHEQAHYAYSYCACEAEERQSLVSSLLGLQHAARGGITVARMSLFPTSAVHREIANFDQSRA